jgi:hypothetical protein
MRCLLLKISAAALAGLGLTGFAGFAWGQSAVPGGTPGVGATANGGAPGAGATTGNTSAGAPAPGSSVGTPGGNINGVGGATFQGTAGGAVGQGTPGGNPGSSSPGTMGSSMGRGQTTAGNVGSYGRFVQPASPTGANVMFGNNTGMFNNPSRTSMFGNGTPSLFGGDHQYGNAPLGSPLGNLQAGGFNAPYGSGSGNGVYGGNWSGIATYPGGLGPSNVNGNFGGGYGNETLGYRGYSSYYGNNTGFPVFSGFVPGYGNGTETATSGPGFGNLGYPNPVTGEPAGTPGGFWY